MAGPEHDRLTTPLVRENGRLIEADWDTAMARVAERSRSLLEAKDPLSHGFFTSGQLVIEEYYTLAVIGKAGIGARIWTATTAGARPPPQRAFQTSFGCGGRAG